MLIESIAIAAYIGLFANIINVTEKSDEIVTNRKCYYLSNILNIGSNIHQIGNQQLIDKYYQLLDCVPQYVNSYRYVYFGISTKRQIMKNGHFHSSNDKLKDIANHHHNLDKMLCIFHHTDENLLNEVVTLYQQTYPDFDLTGKCYTF
jgi:hypothetical protein